jgi:hypothetical protein
VANTLTWVTCLRRLVPIGAISLELVKFDIQQMGTVNLTPTTAVEKLGNGSGGRSGWFVLL